MRFSTVALSLVASALVKSEAVPYANAKAFAEAYAQAEAEAALQHGSEFASTMGEVAMLYPLNREWSEDQELTAPCGSAAGVGNRSDFPLDDGFVSLVAKSTNVWSVSLKISYQNNPTSNDDFDEWANGNVTNDLDIGHTCFYLPDQPSSVKAGDNATIQLEYMAVEDSSNVTHYACSDIKFVEQSVFKTSTSALSCFNATDDSYYSYSNYAEEAASTSAGSSATSSASASTTSSSSTGAAAAVAGISGVFAVMAFNLLI